MKTNLQKEIEWLRSCFKGYDVDEEGLKKIADMILILKGTFPDEIYGYNLYELKQIINYAKQHNFKPKWITKTEK